MAEYHFVSTWQIQAPIERVWEEIYHAERWPAWWKYVTGVDEQEPGAADGVGKRLRLLFRTRLPYTLGFDVQVTRVQPPSRLEARATGELDGTGRWTLTSADGGTLVRYNWDVRTTRRWMNLLAPAARPVFRWNHDELMREGGEGLARRLGVAPVLPGTPARSLSNSMRHQERSLFALTASCRNDGCHVTDAANQAARRRRLREASSTWSARMRRPVQVLRREHPEMGPLRGRRGPGSQR